MHTDSNFSFSFRKKQAKLLNNQQFDLIVIGGGISGAGIAFDAAHRGLKVALIEKNDFASGTSSRSTKLIHGGLRYLQQLQLKFVIQLGRERKILHCNNSNNIIPTPMLLPIYKNKKLKKNLSLFALKFYDMLAGVKDSYKTQWINKQGIEKKYSFINKEGLRGAILYYEYKTNDGRIVIDLLKKAAQKGLNAFNYMEAKSIKIENNEVNGLMVLDKLSGETININAKAIVNATGAWCGTLLKTFDLEMPKQIHHTKGIHMVIKKESLPIRDAFYFEAADGRMMFTIPKQNFTYIGTTDTMYTEPLENPKALSNDIEYLLKATNAQFPGINLSKNDVQSCWAGIRSLIINKRKKINEISRKEELFIDNNGLISITGGKLTGYRLMAEKVVNIVFKNLNKPNSKSSTKKITLSGSNFDNCPSVDQLIEVADEKCDIAKQTGIQAEEFKPLFYRYGTNIDIIIEKAYELMNAERDPELLWLKAELWYAVNYEMVGTLSSFLIYRTEMVLFNNEKINKHIAFIAEELAKLLAWSEEEMNKQLEKFNKERQNYLIPKDYYENNTSSN